jgi:hypothetical protein
MAVLIYVYLPKSSEPSSGNNNGNNATASVLTLNYDTQQKKFNITELEQLNAYTAKGGYRTQSGIIKGRGNYTGVNISTLVQTLNPTPQIYGLKVFSEDGENFTYNYSTILGNITIYNPDNASDPNPIANGGVTMVLAYQYEGQPLNESKDGKLKIVFLDEKGSITAAYLWRYKVTSIQLITE